MNNWERTDYCLFRSEVWLLGKCPKSATVNRNRWLKRFAFYMNIYLSITVILSENINIY